MSVSFHCFWVSTLIAMAWENNYRNLSGSTAHTGYSINFPDTLPGFLYLLLLLLHDWLSLSDRLPLPFLSLSVQYLFLSQIFNHPLLKVVKTFSNDMIDALCSTFITKASTLLH